MSKRFVRPFGSATLASSLSFIIGILSVLVATATPASAASPTAGLDCAGPLECIVLAADRPDGSRDATTKALQFVPLTSALSGSNWFTRGLYRLEVQGTNNCVTREFAYFNATAMLSCDLAPLANSAMFWYIEPIGDPSGRNVDPANWNPWSPDASAADAFTIRNAGDPGISAVQHGALLPAVRRRPSRQLDAARHHRHQRPWLQVRLPDGCHQVNAPGCRFLAFGRCLHGQDR